MARLSRRKLLAALPVMTPAAVAALAARISIADAEHPDAELVRLGAAFDIQHAAWVRARLDADETPGCPFDDEAAADACDRIAEAVRGLPAQTLAGLLVKLRVLAWDISLSVDLAGPPTDLDWAPKCYLAMVREVERMAAIEQGWHAAA
ncbi:hypothetical protein [Ancylobacter terrae]|uniref:hypothetical protein n=1 Tax=Ancylobacter sp. sgz301288 TaxID=3342077 RepID=UPI003858E45D